MPFSWDDRYVLRRVDDDDPRHHRIYKHSAVAGAITDADNHFSHAPDLAAKRRYDARRIDPASAWAVSLSGNPTVMMAVFVLRRLP